MSIVLQFKYAGGSNPGSTRTVYDSSRSVLPRAGLVEGVDLEAGQFRRFDVGKMQALTAIPAFEIELAKLPKSIDPKTVVGGYQQEGKLVHYDTTRNVVVVLDKPKPTGTPIKYDDGFPQDGFYIYGKGQIVRIKLHNGQPRLTFNGGAYEATAENLIKFATRCING